MARRRQPRGLEQSRRRPPRREPYDRVLIVCEGTKTEPQYFRDAIEAYRLSSANVVVTSGRRSDPVQTLETAVDRFRDDSDYESVYVVLDQDVPTYGRAEKRMAELASDEDVPGGLAEILALVPSMPCFEYWLLLHFEETARPYEKEGRRSACADCERDLKRHLPRYTKGGRGVFAATSPHLDEAVARASRRVNASTDVAEPNPVTHVHRLMERLRMLRGAA